MSFFTNFFGTSSQMPKFWNIIQNEQDLNDLIMHSQEKPVLIFKHSTRCIISKTVLRNFEKDVENSRDIPLDFYYLDLLSHRNISNNIAEFFNISHQSPQAILIKNEQAVYHTSHDGISLESIIKHLN